MPSLYPFQLDAAVWLAGSDRAMLLDDQGLGKTISAIHGARLLGVSKMLVLSPPVVLFNWKREVDRFWPGRAVQVVTTGKDQIDGDADVVIVSHGLLNAPGIYAQLLAQRWSLCVVDEAHCFRNRGTLRTRALYGHAACGVEGKSVVGSCDRVWLLTGTPMPNHAGEWWTHLRALAPDALTFDGGKPLSYTAFEKRYTRGRLTKFGYKPIANRNADELRKILHPRTLRRLKEKVLPHLPAVRYETVAVAPPKSYFRDLDWVMPDRLKRKVDAALEELASQREITSDDQLAALRSSAEFSAFRRICGVAKAPAVAELLLGELEFGQLDKVVVFAEHLDVLRVIGQRMADKGYGTIKITGAESAKGKAEAVERFQTDPSCRVALCQLVAASVGVTLTASADVVFAELSFVPAINMQAADRCHRIGQHRPVRVRFLALAGTIDERVTDALRVKMRMIRELLQEDSA